MLILPGLGYATKDRERFEQGETVPVVCMVKGGIYRVWVRKRGAPNKRMERKQLDART